MPESGDFNKVFKILAKNEHKDFVQRIFYPEESDAIVNEDGSTSSHKMAAETGRAIGENPKKWYVFPTIVKDDDGFLVDYKDYNAAWPEAKRKGDFIEFDSKDDAIWFEKHWKLMWDRDFKADY